MQVAAANQENVTLSAARATLHLGRAAEAAETAARVRGIPPAEFREACALLAPGAMSALTLR